MRTAQDIYNEYKILPSLQLHQLRVAAVGKTICDASKQSLNAESVILAGLFHDMGNIIKSDLTYFPEFLEPEGFAYWNEVKESFVKKYGVDHHQANTAIAREIGIPAKSVDLIDTIGFSKVTEVVADPSIERKILQYADMRVGPHGILPLRQRLEEGRERYVKTRRPRTYHESGEEFERLSKTATTLEEQLFSDATLTPEDIHDEKIKGMIEELRKLSVA